MDNARKHKKIKKAVIIAIIAVIALILAALAAIPVIFMGQIVGRHIERPVYESSDFDVESEKITLKTDDGLGISAWLVEPASPRGTIIILSGIENPSVTAFFGYAKLFSDNGYASLLIEMRAHNSSEGDEVALGMKEWLDVKAGVDYLRADGTLSSLPIIALGTSMGAATVNVAAGEIPDINGVISLSAYSSWADVFADTLSGMGLPKWIASLEKPMVNLYLGFHDGFENVRYSPINGIAKIGSRPILLMHSTEDSQVPYPGFERLLKKAQSVNAHITTFIRQGDEHFICYDEYFENPGDDIEFRDALITFLEGNF
jgi:dipeptidyl aminopeptidase/acylaminoacyl peptidase